MVSSVKAARVWMSHGTLTISSEVGLFGSTTSAFSGCTVQELNASSIQSTLGSSRISMRYAVLLATVILASILT